MKKNIALALILLISIGLSACTESGEADEGRLNRLEVIGTDKPDNEIVIFRDKETNCQYMHISAGYGQVIEPVLTAEGKPYCPQK